MQKPLSFFLFGLAWMAPLFGLNAQTATLNGYVREAGSGEPLPGVTVYLPQMQQGTITNTFGYYALPLPLGTHAVRYSSIGYTPQALSLSLESSMTRDVLLQPATRQLDEVTVTADQQADESQRAQLSTITLPVAQLETVPPVLGEQDVIKVLQLLPGVQGGNNGFSGFYVRGGGPDQNLMLVDGVPVYNPSHLMGIVSVFNGAAMKRVQLHKGSFPARYGGRLSSVVNMEMREGDMEAFHGEAGVGVVSAKVLAEGPLVPGKASFLVTARRSFLDFLAKQFGGSAEQQRYALYDINLKANASLGPKDRLYLSGYLGRDRYYEAPATPGAGTQEGGFAWGNTLGALRWNHVARPNLFANTTLSYSGYQLGIAYNAQEQTGGYNVQLGSRIQDVAFSSHWEYYPQTSLALQAGLQSTYHHFRPSFYQLVNTLGEPQSNTEEILHAWEQGLYAELHWQPSPHWRLESGLRLSHFYTQGRHYAMPEPRLAVAYQWGQHWAVKAGYTLMNQYVHMLSQSGIGLPTDLWVPSTANISPQRGQQVSAGLAKDLPARHLSLSAEAYFKHTNGTLAYRPGASYIVLENGANIRPVNWQQTVVQGQGRAWGLELLAHKKAGRLNGWLGYTLSWTQRQHAGINNGQWYYARYDARHDVSLAANYQLSPRWDLSGVFTYRTGYRFTLPLSTYHALRFTLPNHPDFDRSWNPIEGQDNTMPGPRWVVRDFGERENVVWMNFRGEAFHRLDLGLAYKAPRKGSKPGAHSLAFNAYNVYNRANPLYYFASAQEGQLYREALVGFIPSVSYTLQF